MTAIVRRRREELTIRVQDLAAAEQEFAFAAPEWFRIALPSLRQRLESDWFKTINPGFVSVSIQEMSRAWKSGLHPDLVPFCLEPQLEHIDYYCFHRALAVFNTEIVVFADHSIVHSWKNINAFLRWLEIE